MKGALYDECHMLHDEYRSFAPRTIIDVTNQVRIEYLIPSDLITLQFLNDTVILRKISSHWQALRRFIDDSGVAYILGHPVIYI